MNARSLFTSESWAPLADALASEIQRCREGNNSPVISIAVPSQASKHWLLRQLAWRLKNDLAGLQVTTLYQSALTAFLNKGVLPPEVIEDKRYLFSVWQMLQEGPEVFRYPKNDPYPTVRRLYSSLRELRDAAVSRQEAEWLCGGEPYENLSPRETERARKLFALHCAYLTTLKENEWTDSPSMVMQASEISVSSDSPLFIWGFYEFTGVQKLFLKSLLSNHRKSGVFIPEHDYTKNLIAELEGWDLKKTAAGKPEPLIDPLIISCPTAKEEAWAIAKLLLAKFKEGARSGECAVIFRQDQPYFSSLVKTLSENGIPFVSPEDPTETLGAKPLGAALKASIAFWESPSASTAIEILERPCAAVEPSLAAHLKPLVSRVFSLSREPMGRLIQSNDLEKTLSKLADCEGSIPSDKKEAASREAARFLTLCWEGIEIARNPAPAKLASWLEKTLKPPQTPELRGALTRFSELFKSLSPSSLRSRPFASQILREAVSSIELDSARTPGSSGGVWLLNANQARGGEWKHVFICGAVDGAYPMETKEDPFLSEGVRSRLNSLGFGMKFTRFKELGKNAMEDSLLFYLMMAGAKTSLTISLPQLDMEAKPLLPSPYLSAWEKEGKLDSRVLVSAAWQERLRFLENLCPENSGALLNEEEREWENAGNGSASPSGEALVTESKELWEKWLEKPERLSPSNLADFLSCPQAFYWKRRSRLPGESAAGQKEFFSPIFLGGAFGKTLIESFKRHKKLQNLNEIWKETLSKAFPAVSIESLSASERYKMRRVGILFSSLENAWEKAFPEGAAETREEHALLIPLKKNTLYARVDALLSQGRYFEFKLKTSPIFTSSGARTQPIDMLRKILKPENAEGPQYGLQILFYLLDAQNQDGASATLLNAFWEIGSMRTQPPVFYTWKASEDLAPLKEKLELWVSLFNQGAAKNGDEIAFPFWVHEDQGERCGYCDYRTLCLKDSAPVRSRHQPLSAPLAASFAKEKEETPDE